MSPGVSESSGVGDCKGDRGEAFSSACLDLPGRGFFLAFFSGVTCSDMALSLRPTNIR